MPKNFMENVLADLNVELADEFDKNFERKAFFNEPWTKRKANNRKGSLMVVSGRLRRSISSSVATNSITFSSDTPYADIHNRGGEIEVTPKMRKYFWWRAMTLKGDDKKFAPGSDAEAYSFMARAEKIKIPKRQFIGDHPHINGVASKIVGDNLKERMDAEFKRFTQLINKR